MSAALETLSRAERMLAEIATVEDAANAADVAAFAQDLARRAKLGTQSQNHATVIRVRAERRLAELVDQGQREGTIATDGRPEKLSATRTVSEPRTLPDLGLDRRRLAEARKLAVLPEVEILRAAQAANEGDRELSRRELLRRADATREPSPAEPLPENAQGTFRTIVADPPWRYGNVATRANAEGHYDGTLSVPQLCGVEPMPDGSNLAEMVNAWRAEDAHLYLWTTAGFLREAFDVMDAWGFTYKTFLAWVKPQMGMGNYFRVSSELVLFGIRGKLPIADRSLMNWFEAKRGRHSAKPKIFYDLAAQASPGPFLEMFARCAGADALPGTCQCAKCSRGWSAWGNES